MKNIFSGIGALVILTLMIFGFSSYVNRPLFGTQPNQDNTGRQLTYFFAPIADSAGSTCDTITVIPNGYNKVYDLTLSDSCVVAVKGTNSSFIGNHIQFVIHAPASSNSFVSFLGYSGLVNQWACTGNAAKQSLTSSRDFTISFVCTGTKWIEEFESQD